MLRYYMGCIQLRTNPGALRQYVVNYGVEISPFGLESSILIDLIIIEQTRKIDLELAQVYAQRFAYAGINPNTTGSGKDRTSAISILVEGKHLIKSPSKDPDELIKQSYLTTRSLQFFHQLRTGPWSNLDLSQDWSAVQISDLLLGLEPAKSYPKMAESEEHRLRVEFIDRGGQCHPKKEYRLLRSIALGLHDPKTFGLTTRGLDLRDHYIANYPAKAIQNFLIELYAGSLVDSNQSQLVMEYPFLKKGLLDIKGSLPLSAAASVIVGARKWAETALDNPSGSRYKLAERVDFIDLFFQFHFQSLYLKDLKKLCSCRAKK